MKPFTTAAVAVLALVSVVHLLRFFLGWTATVNGVAIPLWVSLLGAAFAGGLSLLVWRENRRKKL